MSSFGLAPVKYKYTALFPPDVKSQFVNLNKLQKNFEQYLSLIIDIALQS